MLDVLLRKKLRCSFSIARVPTLLYILEACALNKHQIASLDFVINIFFMKLFKTNHIEIVKACQ